MNQMDSLEGNSAAEQDGGSLRKRHREQRIAETEQKIQEVKQKMMEAERKQSQWLYWRPILLGVGAGAAITVGLFTLWTMFLR